VLAGFALGFWTPARLGEYAGRAGAFPTADPWTISLSVFAQRMVDMLVGVGCGLGLLLWALHSGQLTPSFVWYATASVGGGTAALLACAVGRPGDVRTVLERCAGALGAWADGLRSRAAFFGRLAPNQVRDALLGSLARYLVFTGQFVCLAVALRPSMPLALTAAAVGLTFYAKYLLPSLTLLDLGVREGGAVVFFGLMGLSPEAGLTAALLLFSLNVLLPAVVGLPLVWTLSVPASPATDTKRALPVDPQEPSRAPSG
jgi:hypothetical protein